MPLLRLLSAAFLALLLLIPGVARGQADESVRVGFIFSDNNIPGTLAAFHQLIEQRPDHSGRIEFRLLTESTFDDVSADDLASSDVLLFDVMNQQLLDRFNTARSVDLLKEVQKKGTVLGIGEGLQSEEHYRELGVLWDSKARAYFAHGGPQNLVELLKLALTRAGVDGFTLAEPQLSLDFGYYYPDGGSGQVFADWASFEAWRVANRKQRPDAPRVAVGFFKANYYSGDMALIDAVIAEIERQGASAVPVFGYPGAVAFQQLLGKGEEVRADVGLGLFFQFNDSEAPKMLAQVGIPVLNLISLYGRSEEEWRKSPQGLSAFEGTFNLASPELAGTIAPTVVGTKEKVRDPFSGLISVITSPIPERVQTAVARGLRYARLARVSNAEKRVALVYYNFPPGKANIGASYLNVAESLANVLRRMADEGYDLGGPAPDAEQVLTNITSKARNVMAAAPGELEQMLAEGSAQRVPLNQYLEWLDALEPTLREKVVRDWGDPAESPLMTVRHDGSTSFVIPTVQYGKIVLLPQPSRAWGEDLAKLYHAKDLAPHHQYVAAYRWLRDGFGADAVVHFGTHGTLEWLDGRDAGLGPDDAPDALIGDLPDLYIYNVDVVGEGLVARRRGMATLVDHMVPPFIKSELTEDLAKLSELLNDHIRNEGTNQQLAEIYGRQARDEAVKLGMAKDLGLDPTAEWTDEELHSVESYLGELRGQTIPYGLHAFGRTPDSAAIDSTVEAIVSVDRSGMPDASEIFAAEMRERILQSGPRELDSLMKALSGKFVPAGKGGEPVRNPDAYPTGANFYGVDPEKMPKPAAWEIGSRLAQQMLDDYHARNGRYPAKVSFVIWGDETMRHEGILESQIFYLLGTKPVWDARGNLVDVAVVPRAELGRPRVDIVIASAAEGMFATLTRMMDTAVQKVKALEEPDNQVRQHYLQTKAKLIASGIAPDDADKMAGVRIFDEPPGNFNLNTSAIVGASGSWDNDAGFANDYIRKMGHGYGNGYWGQPMPDVFKMAISGTDTVVHSSSTTLYGAIDNDDMFMYMGGLASAIRGLDGSEPELLITDTRDPGKPAMTSVARFVGREFRSRYVNPAWIRGMQKDGYAGAGAMREFIEYLWGWDATTAEVVDDAMWQETYETYVEDKQNLGMKQYFETNSPFAYQDITARMIETVRKGYWKTDEATRQRLISEYLDNIAAHGVNCTDLSCGNGRMLRYVMDEAARSGVPAPKIAQVHQAFETAMGRSIADAARELEEFVNRNDARENAERAASAQLVGPSAPLSSRAASVAPSDAANNPASVPRTRDAQSPSAVAPSPTDTVLAGQVLTEEVRQAPTIPPAPTLDKQPAISLGGVLWPAFIFLIILLGWRWHEMSASRAAAKPV